MLLHTFKPGDKDILFIISQKYYQWTEFLGSHYVIPIKSKVSDFPGRLVTFGVPESLNGKKPTKSQLSPHIEELIEYVQTRGITTILCVDSNVFSYLTNQKFEMSIGRAFYSKIEGLKDIPIVPILNASVISQQPNKKPLLSLGLQTATQVILKEYKEKSFEFETFEIVSDPIRAKELLKEYYKLPMVAYDIETTGLDWNTCEFVSHGFAKDRHNAFVIVSHEKFTEHHKELNEIVGSFVKNYKGSLLVHNVTFELRWLTYKYAMEAWDDYKGMYEFINFRKWDDTRYLAYVNLNSTGRTSLGLKDLAKEEYGDWDADIDIKDALNIPAEKLAYYNAIDVSATWYLYEKYTKSARPEELSFYENTIKPFSNQFVKLMLTGYPVHMPTVLTVEDELITIQQSAIKELEASPYVHEARMEIAKEAARKKNLTLKTIQRTPEEMLSEFNPKSSNQLRVLLYEVLQYEVTKLTDSKAPSTDRDTLEKIRDEQVRDDTEKALLEALIGISMVANIISTFTTAMRERGVQRGDDPEHFRVYGNLI